MNFYLYILAFHVMSFMSWMAVLFYLPRLFVYHIEHKEKKEFVEVVEIQEYKLYKYIGVPAIWATVFSGSLMLYLNPIFFKTGFWIYAKLFLVLILMIYSYSMEMYRKQLLNLTCKRSGRFFRMYNEIPTLLSILIVTFVVLKDIPINFTAFIIILFAFVSVFLLKFAKEPNLNVLKKI